MTKTKQQKILSLMQKLGKNNILYLIFSKPQLYIRKLFLRTLYIGVFTLALNLVYVNTDLHSIKIPTTMHSLIGVVIGLLLVFRTNTAYDRWWEGRKSISSISSTVSFFVIKLRASVSEMGKDSAIYETHAENIRSGMVAFLNNLKRYLKHTPDGHAMHVSDKFHMEQMVHMEGVLNSLHTLEDADLLGPRDVNALGNAVQQLLDSSASCERIKNTPIPIAYALHIKVSIFIYLMTLPFGLFYDIGLWATLLVMLVYYMVAGIEIISNEIENPFAGDPNDLPVEALLNSIRKSVNE